MKKYLPIFLYGAIIIACGTFLLVSKDSSFGMTKWLLGTMLTAGAALAFVVAFSRKRTHVQFAYHEMHALAMAVYGVSVMLFCNSFEQLISFTSLLLIFYTFSEIIFGNWLFNLGRTVIYKILIVRVLLGLAVGIGTVVAMTQPELTIPIFGALFILVGINIVLYVPVLKGTQLVANSEAQPE